MTPQTAEITALKALAFLVNSSEALESFMAASGVHEQELREGAQDPGLLTGLLDFLLQQEELLVACCTESQMNARDIHMAAHVLGNR